MVELCASKLATNALYVFVVDVSMFVKVLFAMINVVEYAALVVVVRVVLNCELYELIDELNTVFCVLYCCPHWVDIEDNRALVADWFRVYCEDNELNKYKDEIYNDCDDVYTVLNSENCVDNEFAPWFVNVLMAMYPRVEKVDKA